jgi:hypothetical protein
MVFQLHVCLLMVSTVNFGKNRNVTLLENRAADRESIEF